MDEDEVEEVEVFPSGVSRGFRRGGEVRVVVTYVLPVGRLPLVGWQAITLQHAAFAPIDPNRPFR